MDNTYCYLTDMFKGQPGVVAASGWSLRDAPHKLLNESPVIAVNAAYRYFEQEGLKRPEYLVSLDGRFPSAYKDIGYKFGKDFLWVRYPHIACKPDWKGIKGYRLEDTEGRFIADGSSSHAALHLALITGMNPIYLFGVDLSLSPEAEVYATDEQLCQEKSTYLHSWSVMHDAFTFISKLVEPGRIWDCSPGGALKAFPKRKLVWP